MSKKILHIIPRFTVGGAERLVLQYTAECDKTTYDIAVASVRGGGPMADAFRRAGARVLAGRSFARALGFVHAWRPDIIHTHIWSGDVAGYLITFFFPRIRWVSTQHNGARETTAFRRMILRRILRRADRVIAVSTAVFAWCREDLGIPERKLLLIPNAIALAPWLAVPPLSVVSEKEWHIATVGRLARQKGHLTLLLALAQHKDISWRWEVFGTGPMEQALRAKARSFGIADRIVWHGAVSDMPRHLAPIHIAVQPSLWEGMSLAVMEAMAAGRCIIASDAAADGILEHGTTGIVVPAGDAAMLEAALRTLFASPQNVIAYGAAARTYAREHFDHQAWIAALDTLYQSL
jgi:glycosyltransferase involved in cell wall biosynthesis